MSPEQLGSQPFPPSITRLLCTAKLVVDHMAAFELCEDSKAVITHTDQATWLLEELEQAVEEVEVDVTDQGIELAPFYDAGQLKQQKVLDKIANRGIIEIGDIDESDD